GCSLTMDDAQATLQATGQDRLLQIIGTTARLEQRQVLSTIQSSDPSFKSTPVTCAPTPGTPQPASCSPQALQDKPVTFENQAGTIKYKLSKVLVPGDAISKATAVFATATQTSGQTGWQIDFQLTSAGSKTFSDVTGNLVNQTPP